MDRPHPPTKPCKSCGARIYWALLSEGKKTMPVDEAPCEKGNIQLYLRRGRVVAEVLTREAAETKTFQDIESGAGPRLRRSHFATCANAHQHRKSSHG